MSHNIKQISGTCVPIQAVIVNYTAGGETFTLSEFGVSRFSGLLFAQVAPSQNSLGVPLFPVLDSGAVKLFQFIGGVPTEIPTTAALNATINAVMVL